MSYDVPQIRSDFLFQHLSIALALLPNSIVPLWKEGENLYVKSVTGAFPLLENPFQVGTELLVNADDSKVYPISHPSEVILQTGELKSITLREHPSAGIIYKVRYQDDTISFGQVALKGTEKGDREVEYFSTNMIIDILGANFDLIEDDGRITAINAGGGEFALVSAITRDFFVCEEEEKERYYSPERQPKNTSKHKSGMIVRYLPRFRIRYIGIRENDYSKERRSVLGHQVSGHLRRCRSASPLQLILADQFNVPVPDGFTFVKPHERRGYDQVLYRSRSALALVYGYSGAASIAPSS